MQQGTRHRTARPESFGDTPTESPVTFEQFLASVYDPANRDVFRRRTTRAVSDEDIRSEFVLALYRITFPTDLTPTRANHLLRTLARRFVTQRMGDLARRRTTRESVAARTTIALMHGPAHRAPDPSEQSTPRIARLLSVLANHPAELTECLLLAIRNVGNRDAAALARLQPEVPPQRFRDNLRRVRTIAESVRLV